MPGLSFLSKKSWNTSNIANVEKVWLAEQKAEAEKKKLDELQKQLNEERQIQELRQLQVESGVKVKTVDTSLDWMYQGPSAELQKQQSSEEYLLGKIFKPKQEANVDFNKKDSVTDTSWINKVTNKNDAFTRIHEDPILMIKQEEKRKRELITSNPIKMDKIRKQISSELEKAEEAKRLKKLAKKEKKEKKKESKHKKGDKKRDRSVSRSRDSSDSDDDAGDRKRGRESSLSPPRRDQRSAQSRHELSVSRSPERRRRVDSRSRSRERSDRRRDGSRDDRRGSGGERARDRRDSRDDYRNEDERGRGKEDRRYGRGADSRDDRDRYDRGDRRRDESRDRAADSRRADDRRVSHNAGSSSISSNNNISSARRRDDSRDRSPERRRSYQDIREDSRDRNDNSKSSHASSSSSSSSAAPAVPPHASTNSSSSSSSNQTQLAPKADVRRDDTESDRDSYDSDDSRKKGRKAPVKYGLINKKTSSSGSGGGAGSSSSASGGGKDDNSLGPSAALLQKKAEKERLEHEQRFNRHRTDISKLSEEERQRRIAAMQQDAENNDAHRTVRLSEAERRDQRGEGGHSGNAAFLDSMRKTVYTTSGDMGERLNQNRHYVQSNASMEHDNSYRKN